MRVYGLVYEVFEEERIIGILQSGKIEYFYATKSLFNSFSKYLDEDVVIYFDTNGIKKKTFGKVACKIETVYKIVYPKKHGKEVFYDVNVVKSGISTLINEIGNHLFLDLEMTMPAYGAPRPFVAEVIQCGLVLCDKYNNIIKEYSTFIKPTLVKEISNRTKKFLKITQEDIETGVTFNEFYDVLSKMIEEYKPMVVVWGKNDILSLKDAYNINGLPNLNDKIRFVDLLKLHKNYFNLKNDIGLFACYEKYIGEKDHQEHNALTDALYTKVVYENFKKLCNGLINVDFKE